MPEESPTGLKWHNVMKLCALNDILFVNILVSLGYELPPLYIVVNCRSFGRLLLIVTFLYVRRTYLM